MVNVWQAHSHSFQFKLTYKCVPYVFHKHTWRALLFHVYIHTNIRIHQSNLCTSATHLHLRDGHAHTHIIITISTDCCTDNSRYLLDKYLNRYWYFSFVCRLFVFYITFGIVPCIVVGIAVAAAIVAAAIFFLFVHSFTSYRLIQIRMNILKSSRLLFVVSR